MERRNFLRNISGAVTVPFLLNGLPVKASGSQLFFSAIDDDNENILVLIQLNGGNDGLNTIIPLDKYNILAENRPNIVIPENQILPVNDTLGFHPNMSGLRSLYDEARMAIVHDAGYPNQNRSHFRSTDIWTTGSPADEVWTTGWLGRYFEDLHPAYPEDFPNSEFTDPFALSIDSIVSETCQGTLTNFSLALTDPLSIAPLSNSAQDVVPDTPYGRELEFLRTTIAQANAYGKVISEAAELGTNAGIEYPGTQLANQLRAIALLISGGLRTKVYVANLGGFDTHANQVQNGDPTTGDHANLLQTLSDAVNAFQNDLILQGLEEKVITMTFSEFGRRIRGNGSFGTDHGTAAPMLFFGSCVNPGIMGDSPLLPDRPEVSDGVPMQFDFRSIYGSVLIDWFGVEPSIVSNILQDEFTHLPIVNACNNQTTSTDDFGEIAIDAFNYPNPFIDWTTITLDAPGGNVRISIYDTVGSELQVISNRDLPQGIHEIQYDGSHLAAGNYFIRIITEKQSRTFGTIKVS